MIFPARDSVCASINFSLPIHHAPKPSIYLRYLGLGCNESSTATRESESARWRERNRKVQNERERDSTYKKVTNCRFCNYYTTTPFTIASSAILMSAPFQCFKVSIFPNTHLLIVTTAAAAAEIFLAAVSNRKGMVEKLQLPSIRPLFTVGRLCCFSFLACRASDRFVSCFAVRFVPVSPVACTEVMLSGIRAEQLLTGRSSASERIFSTV